jgi:hypothetical protein
MLDLADSKLAVAEEHNKPPEVAADSKQAAEVAVDNKQAAVPVDNTAEVAKIRTRTSNHRDHRHLLEQTDERRRPTLSKRTRK